jgi:hypothetical protein
MVKSSNEDVGDGTSIQQTSRAKVFSPEATVVDSDTNSLVSEGDRRSFSYKGSLIASPKNRTKGGAVSCEYGGLHHSGPATNVLRPEGADPIATCDMHTKHHLTKIDPNTYSEPLTDHESYKVERANKQDEGLFRTEDWVHKHVGNEFPWSQRKKDTRGPGRPNKDKDEAVLETQEVSSPSRAHVRAAHSAIAFAVEHGDHTGPSFDAYLHHAMNTGGLTVPEAKNALIHGVRSYEKQQGITSIVSPRPRTEIVSAVKETRDASLPGDARDAAFREAAGLMEDTGASTARETKKYRGSTSE